jgi:ankyrin repeat protein
MLLALMLFLVGTICFVRQDYLVRRVVTEHVLGWEQSFGRDFGLLKSVLGISLSPTPDALAAAIESGDTDGAAAIIRSGLDPDTPDTEGQIPAVLAVQRANTQVMKILLAKGVDLNKLDRAGQSPLTVAIKKNDVETTRFLVLAGADPNFRDAAGDTPLHHAVRVNNEAIIDLLFGRGANPNQTDNAGRTPLFDAVEKKDVKLTSALLERGANVRLFDKTNNTALAIAGRNRDDEMLQLLRQAAGLGAPPPGQPPPPVIAIDAPPTGSNPAPPQQPVQPAAPAPKPPPLPKNTMTRVRALGEPAAVWTAKGRITLDSIRAPVRNVGDVPAEGVVVTVRIPGGKAVTLQGPARLERNQKADYTATPMEVVPFVQRLEADATCKNCHRG